MTSESNVPEIDLDIPNPARMYDYFLGGSHNFAADRAAAERVKSLVPFAAASARTNRAFLGRAVRFCRQEGITQFLDLGSGIPTVGNVHEIARAGTPAARVAYVDNEPVAAESSAAILAGDPLTTITQLDLRDVDAVLAAPSVSGLLDFSRPIALLTVAVLHFIPDADDPAGIAARYRSHLAPGSLHVLSHGTGDHDPDVAPGFVDQYRTTSNPFFLRSRNEVAGLLDGLELVEPGLVDAKDWRPDDTGVEEHAGFWAAVGRLV